ncbi:Mpo1-like protein [Nannocystis punicea]|uniref:DUF962 domain-containing protein n=1 Tax=Nannocystis punicea TaxID=2995304 RepID=A0ABY7GWD0_9BACT|nr:Mpo1-like protein [Nannocystis poenicansa]WAS91210.1 DUF962 domain-containing protein [Nannocystis poenicansa]
MTESTVRARPLSFLEELREQRWDDHRYYHRSRVNQALHLFSACCFLAAYVLIPVNPIAAALLGWVIAMWSRQIGHFFFEPKGYDEINQATFAHKEEIKVGFNLQRKLVLLAAWSVIPALLWISPSLFGAIRPHVDWRGYLDHVGWSWLALGFVGLVGRTLYLCLTRNAQTGAVWFTKILTDPFHDIMLYHKAPLQLLRGEWLDPMDHVIHGRGER